MNLLLMANQGMPRNGLVALYDPYRDTYGRNILPVGSENFVTGWVANSSETITVTDYPTTINGQAVVAKRIQGAGNGGAIKKYYCVADGRLNPHLDTISVYVQKLNTTNCFMRHTGINPVTISATMQRLSISVTQNATYTALDFLTQNIADSLDIVVYQPQINLSTLYPYSPPAGLPQSLTDYTGRGNNAQLGSTAGADTNDPTWNGGLVFGADDYAMLPTMPELDITKKWTAIFIINSGTAGTARCIWQKGVNINNRMSINISTINELGLETYNGVAYTGKFLPNSTGNTNYIITAECTNNSLSLMVNGVIQNSTGSFNGSSLSGNYIGMGKNGTVFFNTGVIYSGCFYNRLLSNAEQVQAYNYLRRLMSSRGITI